MESLFSNSILAIVTFAATNIDDLLILSLYFSNPEYKRTQVVLGQYIGVLALTAAGLSGAIAGQFIDPEWIGLLGVLPIFLGIKSLVGLIRNKDEDEKPDPNAKSRTQFISVALITIANGGDNIGVYTPLFATIPPSLILLYIAIFTVMIGCWCAFAHYLVKHPLLKTLFTKSGHIILPFFLILLGIWIIYDSGVLTFLFNS